MFFFVILKKENQCVFINALNIAELELEFIYKYERVSNNYHLYK